MLQQGDRIGPYEIVRQVGKGGMATVYQAYHEKLDRHVAIKLMHERFLQDEGFHARFLREARIVARLEHQHIVPIYDFNEHEGVPYLVMKYVAGMTLKRQAIKTGLTLGEIATYLTPIAAALDYAHEQGVLHRDMKPSNILIDSDGKPYITDFGLARMAEAGESTISHDMMLGTPFYISPEQARGERELDKRTDIYSLGIILYELITGQVPFQADTPYAIVHGHIYQVPQAPTKRNPQLPHSVDAVLERALAKKPQARYPTARAMLHAFRAAINNDAASASHQAAERPRGTPHAAPQPPISSPASDWTPDIDFNFGDIDIGRWGHRIKSRVTGFTNIIQERIENELSQHKETVEEAIIRRRVQKRLEARREFLGHLATYAGVNGVLVFIWLMSGGFGSFFWPIFPIFFWGLGLAGQGYEYYTQHGPGASRRESLLEKEVRREMQRSRRQSAPEKEKAKNAAVRLGDIVTTGDVRTTEDGELSDSFVDEQGGSR